MASVSPARRLSLGMIFLTLPIDPIGFSVIPAWMRYTGLALEALGAGAANPSTTGPLSLCSGPEEQGRVLGIFRWPASWSRAGPPVLAGAMFFLVGSHWGFVAASVLAAP